MLPNFPTSLDALANPSATTRRNDPGFELHVVVGTLNDIAEQLEAKLGPGAANQVPVGGAILTGLTNGTSEWLPSLPCKNKMVNPRFSVSERMFVAQTDNAYWIDGWRTLLENANAVTWARDTADVPPGAKYAARGTVGSANNNKFGIWQTIEDREIADLIANNLSCSVWLKATAGIGNVKVALAGWSGTANATTGDPISAWNADAVTPTLAANWAYLAAPSNLSVTTSWARYKVAENLVVGAYTNLAVLIWCDDKTTTAAADILRVADVQVEPGKVCTAIEERAWAVDAALALARHADLGGAPANSIFLAHDVNGAARTLGMRLAPPVPMRAAPSVTVRGTWSVANINTGNPIVVASDRFAAILGMVSTAAGYSSIATVDSTTYVSFDAEI
jgi:hypothetical protein